MEKPLEELEPHAYVPSAMHMGDCQVCGHLQGSPIHSPFTSMGTPISDAEIRHTICWDDGEDRDAALAGGKYVTCAGEWRQRPDTCWQFFKDPTVEI